MSCVHLKKLGGKRNNRKTSTWKETTNIRAKLKDILSKTSTNEDQPSLTLAL